MRQRSVFLTLAMVLVLLVPALLGCGEKSPYGPAQLHFPDDEGAHPGSKVEWWYLNATVSDNAGHQYTAMLAYFHPTLKIISIADLDAEVFYHEVPTIEQLMVAESIYAAGGLDLRWGPYDRWYRTDEDSGPRATPSASASTWHRTRSLSWSAGMALLSGPKAARTTIL
jgi:predicted small lipoprotein YifL